uniref:Uncharacterized protein n=1 Tax=Panagrolaimus sp. PS1159 TaxID=55785 RepID=A0AC35GY77_9BILA
MNQIENAFALPETRENHPITEESKKESKILGEIKDSLKITIGGGNGGDSEKREELGKSDKLANTEAYANAQFEAEYQSAKEKAREEMKEQMCSGNP